MTVTTFESGLRHGRKATLQEQLEARFGPLSPRLRERLENLSLERLQELGVELLAWQSIQESDMEALMQVPAARPAGLHAEALRRLAESGEKDYRRYLLLDCLEAYTTLDEAQTQELEGLLQTERYKEVRVMMATIFEKGRQEGVKTMLREQLEARFGSLGVSARERLENLSPEQLQELGLALLKAQSLQELGLEG